MTKEELYELIHSDESYRIERTVSTGNMDKFQEAICAFANDMPGKRQKGYLLIGVYDDGRISGLNVDDALMKKISGIRSDGNILPLPVMNTEKVITPEGDVLVVEVTPSFDTPVRYRGRTFIRIGPRKDIASMEEERILSERCAAALPTFDTRPCREATINDIDTDLIVKEYMPRAVDSDILAHDTRSLKEQLASLHLFNLQWDCPTYAALVMFGHNTKYFLPGAYIQYVRFKGETNGGEILNERRFEGNLCEILPLLENFIRDGIVTRRPVPVSILREKDVNNYPYKALRELCMNAIMHRDYQSNMPVRVYQYDDRIEISNAGGLYGNARPENFPHMNDYRNNVVAEIMKAFNYVNKFNHGIQEVMDECAGNGNPPAEFKLDLITAFLVRIMNASVSEGAEQTIKDIEKEKELVETLNQLVPQLKSQVKALILTLKDDEMSATQLQLVPELVPPTGGRSHIAFKKYIINPCLEYGLIEQTYPGNPRHPKQKYRLTELGMSMYKQLRSENDEDI